MKKNVSRLIYGLSILFFGSSVFCSVSLADSGKKELVRIEKRLSSNLSLPDLLTYSYLSNPAIKASRESWKIVIESYRIGKSYPDPQLMMTYYPSPIETRLGPQDWNLTFTQAIPFPGKLARKGKALEADTRISKIKLDRTVRNIVTSISRSYYELRYIQQAIEIAEANYNLNLEMIKISETAYAQDKALFYDISKARAQTAQIQYDILLLQELEQTEKARVNTLLNRSPDALLGKAGELAIREVGFTLPEIYDLSLEHQEDILIQNEKIIKSDELIKLARYDSLPSFKLGLFYAGIGKPDIPNPSKDAGKDAIGVQLGLSIPVWFGKNKSNLSKAAASQRKATAEKLQVVNTTKARISRLWFKLQNSRRLIDLYENNLIPQSLRAVQTAETWYRQEESSFADFLEIQATSYNFQLALARAKADYGQNLASLEQLAGVLLDSRNASKKGGDSS